MSDVWYEDMACREADPRIFEEPSSPSGRSSRYHIGRKWAEPALALCDSCPVRERCLDEALRMQSDGEHHARLVIGGLLPDEFTTLQRRREGALR